MGRAAAPHIITDDSALGGSLIQRSLRFNGADTTAHLTRTPSSSGNRKLWTFSAWIKIAHTDNGPNYIYAANNGNTSYVALYFRYKKLYTYFHPGNNYGEVSSRLFNDVGSWIHVVHQVDAANTTQSIWINGEVLSLNSGRNPGNSDYGWNRSGVTHRVGNASWRNDNLDGYLADVYHIDGQLIAPSSFGYTDFQTGLWRPKKYEGTYGTNGFHLDFSDNSAATAATIGKDRSGNGNDFTPNSLSVSAGEGNDSLEDTPTNNFCTMNPLLIGPRDTYTDSSAVFSNGNLKIVCNGSGDDIGGTIAVNSGKWYYEVKLVESQNHGAGWTRVEDFTSNEFIGSNSGIINTSSHIGSKGSNQIANNGTVTTASNNWDDNDIVGFAFDIDSGELKIYHNGSLDTIISSIASDSNGYIPIVGDSSSTDASFELNFGQRAFSYTPPTGFKTLCSANLPPTVPSITNPQKHFNTVIYTGDGTTGRIIDAGFDADFVWCKSRSVNGGQHFLSDSVRGSGKLMQSESSGAEYDAAGNGIHTKGAIWGSGIGVNGNGSTYVNWFWKAGGAAVSNSDGAITSSVSVNDEAGFSIVSYSGNGNSTATIGHGLSKAPKWIITKCRSTSTQSDWVVWHEGLSDNKNVFLNQTGSETTPSYGHITDPTSTLINVSKGSGNQTNASGQTYISYCWSEVPGFSKFGKYTGNGSTDGQYVHLGFRPAWVMVKRYDGAGQGWNIFDNKRNPFNLVDEFLIANSANAEATGSALNLDFLSNGFKFRGTDGGSNTSGSDYIYMAFAEQPGTTPYDTQTNAR